MTEILPLIVYRKAACSPRNRLNYPHVPDLTFISGYIRFFRYNTRKETQVNLMTKKNSASGTDKYIKALAEISRAITSEQYPEDILKLIVMVTAKVTEVEICSLWLIEEDQGKRVIRLKATQAFEPEYVQDRILNMNEGVVGYVATHRTPVIIKDILKDERFKEKEMARKLGLVSMMGIPMQIKNEEVIGVLNCFTAAPHNFSDTEVNLVTAVANQAAVAIQNTKLIVEAEVIREELETRKLVERAKEVLIRKRRMEVDEAFRWIQKRSMDSRKPLREVAEAVLLSEDLY